MVNLVPPDAPHKGSALGALMQREGMERLIYLGDDETDEDVFANGALSTLLGVRVASRSGSAERARSEARGS